MFCAGKYLYALDPKTGQPIADFGEGGKTLLPGRAQGDFGAATAGPTIFERIIVVPGFEKDVWGFDVVSRQTSLDVSHRAAAGRVWLRHLGSNRALRRELLGRHGAG